MFGDIGILSTLGVFMPESKLVRDISFANIGNFLFEFSMLLLLVSPSIRDVISIPDGVIIFLKLVLLLILILLFFGLYMPIPNSPYFRLTLKLFLSW